MTQTGEIEQRARRLRDLGIDVVDGTGVCTIMHRHDGATIAHVNDPDVRSARARAIGQAERALRLDPIDSTLADTFPASDPPAAGQPGIA
jgi:hypothetical protein